MDHNIKRIERVHVHNGLGQRRKGVMEDEGVAGNRQDNVQARDVKHLRSARSIVHIRERMVVQTVCEQHGDDHKEYKQYSADRERDLIMPGFQNTIARELPSVIAM